MTQITKTPGANPVVSTAQYDRQMSRNVVMRNRRANLKESIEETHRSLQEASAETLADAETFENAVEKQMEFNKTHTTKEAIPSSFKGLYEEALERLSKPDARQMVYLLSDEVESFLQLLDPEGKKKAKFQDVVKALELASEGEEEGIIDKAAQSLCSNHAEIYLLLCYLLQDLANRKAKAKLQERLRKIIDQFEHQESAYLANFFSSENLLAANPESGITASFLNKMANISSGQERIDSLRQTLQFVRQMLPKEEQMFRMVSLFMKFQAKNLKKITTLNEGRESKEEIASILKQERNLIDLNSLYSSCRQVCEGVAELREIKPQYGEMLHHVVAVIESALISVATVNTIYGTLQAGELVLPAQRELARQLKELFRKAPPDLFLNDKMRDKMLDAMNSVVVNFEKLSEPKGRGLSFLNSKKVTHTNHA